MDSMLHDRMPGKLYVAVVGNSVAMRVRPPLEAPDNCNYSVHIRSASVDDDIRKNSFQVVNWSSGGATIRDIHKELDQIVRLFPDYYVLNLGVVDASTRDIPRWFFRIVNSTNQSRFHSMVSVLYGGVIRRARRTLVFIRGKRSWISSREFKKLYGLLVDKLLKETNAEIIGLSINIASERVERALPGSGKNHLRFNQIIENCLEHPRCQYLDLTDLDQRKHYPDGVHFSAEGHQLVADRIIHYITLHAKQHSKG